MCSSLFKLQLEKCKQHGNSLLLYQIPDEVWRLAFFESVKV